MRREGENGRLADAGSACGNVRRALRRGWWRAGV